MNAGRAHGRHAQTAMPGPQLRLSGPALRALPLGNRILTHQPAQSARGSYMLRRLLNTVQCAPQIEEDGGAEDDRRQQAAL